MIKRLLFALGLVVIAIGLLLGIVVRPDRIAAEDLPARERDAANGERVFWASGCASCHADPEGDDQLRLSGGRELNTRFGTFNVPNVSMHEEDGIGAWSEADFVNALLRGISPSGQHYYPSFPYTSYQRMRVEDVQDLYAFWQGLPAVESGVPDHDLRFPYSMRWGLGLWKRRHLDGMAFAPVQDRGEIWNRGAYLVEGPGHCGECHTPRDRLGALRADARFSGGPAPEGQGEIPNITPHEDGLADWSEEDIVYYLEEGFTPDFDTVGGSMAAVQRSLSRLPREDLEAIAVYLKDLPALPDETDAPPEADGEGENGQEGEGEDGGQG